MSKLKPVPPPSMRAIARQGPSLVARIDELVEAQQSQDAPSPPDRTALQGIVLGIFENISAFDMQTVPQTQKASALKAWVSLLAPIERLAALRPHGNFLAARMLLYFTSGFSHTESIVREFQEGEYKLVAERAAFILRLDETLLGFLKPIWKDGGGYEQFNWVLSDYSTLGTWMREDRKAEIRALVPATSPEELFALGGGIGKQFWRRKEGDWSHFPRPSNWSGCSYLDQGPNGELLEGEDRLLASLTWGSDGPVRDHHRYDILTRAEIPPHRRVAAEMKVNVHYRPALRRSLQFVLDARKIADKKLQRDGQRLAQVIMERIYPLPAEIRSMVFSYITENVAEDLYVERLDLPNVYCPFPEWSLNAGTTSKCELCAGKPRNDAETNRKVSCPHATVVIWNLPLRAFMTFHRADYGRPSDAQSFIPCKYPHCHETGGHHETEDWKMTSENVETELDRFINGIIRKRHGPDATLASVGLGPVAEMTAPSDEEDRNRAQELFYREGEWEDVTTEWRRRGLGGLFDTMIHGSVLEKLGPSPYMQHQLPVLPLPWRTPSHLCWMYGLRKSNEEMVGAVFRKILGPVNNHCWLCRTF